MIARIQVRRDTTVNWELHNPPLRLGEIGLDITNNKFKVGGESDSEGNFPKWNDLNYELGQWQGHTRTVQIGDSEVDIHDIKYGFQDDEGDVYINNDLFVNNDVKIEGNLTVRGDTTTVNTVNSTFKDNIIELNLDIDDTGNYNENLESGIQVNRGILDGDTESSFQRIYWKENDLKWVIDADLNVLGDLYSNGTKLWSINSFSDIWFNGTVGIGDFDQTDALDSLHILNTVEDSNPGVRIQNDEQTWAIYTRGSDSDKLKFVDISSTELGTTPFQIETNSPNNSLYIQGGTESTGNVGIGTDLPSSPLHVVGSEDADRLLALNLTNKNNSDSTETAIRFSNSTDIDVLSAELAVQRQSDISNDFWLKLRKDNNTTTQVLTVKGATGNVGIGTTSPEAKLTVDKTGQIGFVIQEEDSNEDIYRVHMMSSNSNDGYYIGYAANGVEGYKLNSNGDSYLMGGNVGIGETTPTTKLEILGSPYVLTDSGKSVGGIHLRTEDLRSDGEYTNAISFSHQNHTASSSVSGVVTGGDGDNLGLAFITHPSSTGTHDAVEAMRINHLGNVGIGTQSPNYSLEVVTDTGIKIKSKTDGSDGSQIVFSSHVPGNTSISEQYGWIKYDHSNGNVTSTGDPVESDDGFVIGGTEADTVVKIEGHLKVEDQLKVDGRIITGSVISTAETKKYQIYSSDITDEYFYLGKLQHNNGANGYANIVVYNHVDYGLYNNTRLEVQINQRSGNFTGNATLYGSRVSGENIDILCYRDSASQNIYVYAKSDSFCLSIIEVTHIGGYDWQMAQNSEGTTVPTSSGAPVDGGTEIFDSSDNIDFMVSQNGFVGIGTSTPSQKLSVAGNMSVSGDIYEGDSKLSDTYLSSVTVNTGTGIVGGATLTPSSTSVNISLDFAELADMTTDISPTTQFILLNGNTESRKAASEINLSEFNVDIDTSKWSDSTSVTGAIHYAGKVGIREPSPSAMLDINSDITGGTNEDLRITNSAATEQWHRGILILHPNIANKNAGTIIFGNAETTGNSGHISFKNSAVDGEEKVSIGIYGKNGLLNINGNGNVGIGTILDKTDGSGAAPLEPTSPLHIFKDVETDSGVTDMLTLHIETNDIAADPLGPSLLFKCQDTNNADNTTARIKMMVVQGDDFGDVSGETGAGERHTNLVFETTAASTSSDQMVITGAGNVGIGKIKPTEKLDVNGNITATGNITSASDITLKENIELITDPIKKVKELGGYTFNKKGEDLRMVGLIAQEVQKVLPEAVHENQEGIKSLAYGNMVALLVECIKKQDERIETLEKTIEKLKL